MRIRLIAVGTRMPAWVEEGYQTYARRLPAECRLQLQEVKMPHRGKGADVARLCRQEGEALLAATPERSHRVALEVEGRAHTTAGLAKRLRQWLDRGEDVAIWVGGPDGLDHQVSTAAAERWSLSPLTLPHPLVRVVVAEQIYRAWSILNNHPYHR